MQIKDYIKDIQKKIKGEKTIDVGCLGSYTKSQLIRHNQYKQSTSELVGIDYNIEFLNKAKSEGHKNLFYCDITNLHDVKYILEIFGTFQHVIATDVLEHIENTASFLEGINLLMREHASFYLTTPNVRSAHWISMFLKKKSEKINDDHVCWFEESTLRATLNRHNLVIESLNYCTDSTDKKAAKLLGLKFEEWMGRRMYAVIRRKSLNEKISKDDS